MSVGEMGTGIGDETGMARGRAYPPKRAPTTWPEATIEITHVNWGEDGEPVYEFAWIGLSDGVVRVAREMEWLLQEAPWPLRKVEDGAHYSLYERRDL